MGLDWQNFIIKRKGAQLTYVKIRDRHFKMYMESPQPEIFFVNLRIIDNL